MHILIACPRFLRPGSRRSALLERSLSSPTALVAAIALVAGLASFVAPPASGQSLAFNITPLDQIVLGPPLTVTDVDVDGGLAFVGRGPLGLTIADISAPGGMQVVSEFNLPGQLLVNDVQAAKGRVYITNESFNGVAVYILDVSNPAQPQVIGGIIQPIMNIAHNLFIDGNILYVIGHGGANWQTFIFDVSDPAAPVFLTILPTLGAHDITVLDGILYEAGGWSGLHLWDVADPAHPVHLAAADLNAGPLPHYHTHSVWPTEDRRYILTMNELVTTQGAGQIEAGGLKIWSWDGGSQLTQVASWRPDVALGSTVLTIHNAVVLGRHAYVSHYQAGIRVLDLRDPEEPVEVAFYDTYGLPPVQLFEGCWGVDLGAPLGNHPIVYGSYRTFGLFQLEFNGARRARLTGEVRNIMNGEPVAGASVRLVTADRNATTDAAGQFQVLTGEGRHLIVVSAPGYISATLEVNLNAGSGGPPLVVKLTPDIALSWSPARPTVVQLAPAHPNPFQAETTIPFEVSAPEAAALKLSVHDAMGRTVRVLVDGAAAPGRQAAVWDGRDARGAPVPAGVYYLRLVAGGSERSGRVQLVR